MITFFLNNYSKIPMDHLNSLSFLTFETHMKPNIIVLKDVNFSFAYILK